MFGDTSARIGVVLHRYPNGVEVALVSAAKEFRRIQGRVSGERRNDFARQVRFLVFQD
jgi:hypothetical protein